MSFPGLNRAGAQRFSGMLTLGAKILVSEPADLPYFVSQGFEAESFAADASKIGFFNPPRETFDGIWADRSLFEFEPTLCQRTVQIFFSALKPKGILFVSFLESEKYPLEEFEAMLRQSGFEPVLEGRNEREKSQIAFLARRI